MRRFSADYTHLTTVVSFSNSSYFQVCLSLAYRSAQWFHHSAARGNRHEAAQDPIVRVFQLQGQLGGSRVETFP